MTAKMLYSEDEKLIFRFDDHVLWVQPWGENAFRVRATKLASMPSEDWALSSKPETKPPIFEIDADREAKITNGKITATVSRLGKLIVYDDQVAGGILAEQTGST